MPWIDRVWREFRAGNPTRAYRDVLLTLRTFRGRGGAIYPSHATLADRVDCGERTVRRALAMGQRLGLVRWTERRVRAGWRWLRSSNLYSLALPDGEVQLGLRRVWPARVRTSGQLSRGGESLEKRNREQTPDTWLHEATRGPDLLAMRRRVFAEKVQIGGYAPAHSTIPSSAKRAMRHL